MLAIGHALRNWSRAERVLTGILWRCMGNKTLAPEANAWGDITSLPARLSIVEHMLSTVISDADALALWRKISAIVTMRNRVRNNLADYRIVRFGDGPRLVPECQSVHWAKFGRTGTAKDDAPERPEDARGTHGYTAAEIWRISENFGELTQIVAWYRDWVVEFGRIPHELDVDSPQWVAEFLSTLRPVSSSPKAPSNFVPRARFNLSSLANSLDFFRLFGQKQSC